MTREGAAQILSLFLLEDVDNNRNYYEGSHDITFVGNHFAVRERATGKIFTFRLALQNSDMPFKTWYDEFVRQEWIEEGEKVDQD
jgi:hypothetical protein